MAWIDATDAVILNSPWLQRRTGNLLRFIWLIFQVIWWTIHLREYWNKRRNYGPLLVMLVAITLGVLPSLCRGPDTLATSLGLAWALVGSNLLQAMMVWDFSLDHAFTLAWVALCHCNCHPVALMGSVLFFVPANLIYARNSYIGSMRSNLLNNFQPELTWTTTVFAQVGGLLLAGAFTWDFTLRVRAVSSGVLFGRGEEVLQSPVAGRSARQSCWALGASFWLHWALTQRDLRRFALHGGVHQSAECIQEMGSLVPLCCIAPFLTLAVLLWSLVDWTRESKADGALALLCCVPPTHLMIQAGYIGSQCIKYHGNQKAHFPLSVLLSGGALISALMSMQALIQASCDPALCGICALVFSISAVYMASTDWRTSPEIHFDLSQDFSPASPLVSAAVWWVLVFSHGVDYYRRLSAIQEGLAASRTNAASSEMVTFLRGTEDRVAGISGCQEGNSAETSAPEDAAALPGLGGEAAPPLAVAVVRHAERADSHEAFDAWCTAEDAEQHPLDPPITKQGLLQAQELAEALSRQKVEFQVVISSPFLRCLQTATVLAEHFNASILLDQELCEVLGPDVYEVEPPEVPWRAVAKMKSLLQETSASRLNSARLMGQRPKWPEQLGAARCRYAKRFFDYLRRARHTKRSCILVSHGHMVQVCASVLPACMQRKIISVDYAGVVLATCHRVESEASGSVPRALALGARSQSLIDTRAKPTDGVEEAAKDPQKQLLQCNQLMQAARLKYWQVWMQGVRYVSARQVGTPKVLQQLQAHLGPSWRDVERLLGLLPSQELSPGSESGGSFSTNTHTATSMRTCSVTPAGCPTPRGSGPRRSGPARAPKRAAPGRSRRRDRTPLRRSGCRACRRGCCG
ncbi:unnamed protein product [Effrenium voratum]|nr:unnamed protein product [Effrenium voratum]